MHSVIHVKCICGAPAGAGIEQGQRCVFHGFPYCKEFAEKDPGEWLRWVRHTRHGRDLDEEPCPDTCCAVAANKPN